MPATFDALFAEYPTSGIYVHTFDLSYSYYVLGSTLVVGRSVPDGCTAVIETNLSLNMGLTWRGWYPHEGNGQAISGIDVGVDLSQALLKVRVTLTSSSANMPAIGTIIVHVDTNYGSMATWTSAPINTMGVKPLASVAALGYSLEAGTNIILYERDSYDGNTWSEWTQITDGSVSAIGSMRSTPAFYRQYKAELYSDVATHGLTPAFTSLLLQMTSYTVFAVWASPVVEVVTDVENPTGMIATAYDTGTNGDGYLNVLTTTSDDGVTWDYPKYAKLDGTIQSAFKKYIKVYVLMFNSPKLDSLTIVYDKTPSLTLLSDDFNPVGDFDFDTLRNVSIIVNGIDAPRKWDGITAEPALLGGSPPVMSMIVAHQNAIWGVESAYTSRVRKSNTLDYETWDAYGFFDFNAEDGDYITSILKYGENLLVSKRYSMALLTGNADENYNISWLDTINGCVSKRGMAMTDDGYVAYIAADGIRLTDMSNNVLLSDVLDPDWEKINHKALVNACIICWKKKILVALPKEGSVYNNVVWCYDIPNKAWSIYEGWNVSRWNVHYEGGVEILTAGNSITGQVHKFVIDSFAGDETPSYDFTTKTFDLGYPDRYKVFKTVYVDIEAVQEEALLTVEFIVDGVTTGAYSTMIPAGDARYMKRLLPPMYGAVLGKTLALRFTGVPTIEGIGIEYIVKGAVAPDTGEV